MAPTSAWRYISPKSVTTGAAAVCTLIRLSPQDAVYLFCCQRTNLMVEPLSSESQFSLRRPSLDTNFGNIIELNQNKTKETHMLGKAHISKETSNLM